MEKTDKLSPESKKRLLLGMLLGVLGMIVVGLVLATGTIVPFLVSVAVTLIVSWRIMHYRKLIPRLRAERKELDDRFRQRQIERGVEEAERLEPIQVPWWLLAFRYEAIEGQVVLYARRFHWVDLVVWHETDEGQLFIRRFTAFDYGLLVLVGMALLLYNGTVLPWWAYVGWLVFISVSLVRWLSYYLVLTDRALRVVRAVKFGFGDEEDLDLRKLTASSVEDTTFGNMLGYKNIGKSSMAGIRRSFARHLRFVVRVRELNAMIRKLDSRTGGSTPW